MHSLSLNFSTPVKSDKSDLSPLSRSPSQPTPAVLDNAAAIDRSGPMPASVSGAMTSEVVLERLASQEPQQTPSSPPASASTSVSVSSMVGLSGPEQTKTAPLLSRPSSVRVIHCQLNTMSVAEVRKKIEDQLGKLTKNSTDKDAVIAEIGTALTGLRSEDIPVTNGKEISFSDSLAMSMGRNVRVGLHTDGEKIRAFGVHDAEGNGVIFEFQDAYEAVNLGLALVRQAAPMPTAPATPSASVSSVSALQQAEKTETALLAPRPSSVRTLHYQLDVMPPHLVGRRIGEALETLTKNSFDKNAAVAEIGKALCKLGREQMSEARGEEISFSNHHTLSIDHNIKVGLHTDGEKTKTFDVRDTEGNGVIFGFKEIYEPVNVGLALARLAPPLAPPTSTSPQSSKS